MAKYSLDLLCELVRFINTLNKGSRTIAYMTALLVSWEDMDEAQINKIIDEAKLGACFAVEEDFDFDQI